MYFSSPPWVIVNPPSHSKSNGAPVVCAEMSNTPPPDAFGDARPIFCADVSVRVVSATGLALMDERSAGALAMFRSSTSTSIWATAVVIVGRFEALKAPSMGARVVSTWAVSATSDYRGGGFRRASVDIKRLYLDF